MTDARNPADRSVDPADLGAPQGAPSLDNVVVVLSHTTEPMNIGAACRAMKTMGLEHLRLIAPLNPKGRSARALAHGAEDILERALVVDTLLEAVGDCRVVAGTTARRRQLRKHSLLGPEALAAHVVDHARQGRVALLFGTERTGLTNEEADICRYLARADTAPGQPSLNLAQAVTLFGWEIRQAWRSAGGRDPGERGPRQAQAAGPPAQAGGAVPQAEGSRPPEMRVRHPYRTTRLPTQVELENMYGHLAHAMTALGYPQRESRKFLTYLRQLHMRAGIVNWETHIYHILCRRILKATGSPDYPGASEDGEDEDMEAQEPDI